MEPKRGLSVGLSNGRPFIFLYEIVSVVERFSGAAIFSLEACSPANPMIPEDIRKRLESLRFKAEEARVYAETMNDQGCRAALEAMAASYDAMAVSLENSILAHPDRWTKTAVRPEERVGRSA
jgi:hypothetical protein